MLRKIKAFTLIELLVVVLIIGILAAVAVPQYQKAVLKSRMVEGITQIRALAQAEKIYFLANDSYTTNIQDLDLSLPGEEKTTNNISQIDQPHWTIFLWTATTFNSPFVYAKFKDGPWYIRYYFDSDQFTCEHQTGQDSTACKLVGVHKESCPLPGNECYVLN